jgi:manganese/zinc/iron transport system substrate-binding protein
VGTAQPGQRAWLVVFGIMLLAATGGPVPAARADTAMAAKPLVVATIGMIADVAHNVAAECADVITLMGPGVDPHLYRASARDVRTLQEASAILYSGYALEGQLGEILDKLGQRKPTLAVSPAAIPPDELITAQGAYGVDPHLWMDARLWSDTAPVIADAIGKLVPACATALERRAKDYKGRLEALHAWVEASVASIPDGQRTLVTAHDAFAYYGRAYGIDVAAIQGISTEAEAGVADIRAVVNLVVEKRVPAVFVESTINPRTIQAVIDAAAERGQPIQIGGRLYSDAMGAPGTPGGSYIGMLFENTRAIVEALGGHLAPLPAALHDWAAGWNITVAEH